MELKYPYYADNNTLSIKTVITIDGDTEYRANCLKKGEEYLVKGKHVVLINEKWYLKDRVFFDHEKKVYTLNHRYLVTGVIGVKEDGMLKFGFFSRNPYKNCTVYNNDGILFECIDYNILEESKLFIEDVGTNIYHKITELTELRLEEIQHKRLVLNNHRNQYNIVDDKFQFENICNLYKQSKFSIDKDIKNVNKYLKNTTFGIELETINGSLPNYIKNKYGVIVCKDGSTKNEDGIYPPEYVTVPMSGSKGLQAIRNLSKEITKRSDIDFKCSYHLHIGGFEKSRLFLISLMKLCCKIQNDVFEMFPVYKTDEIKYANKEKNYCKKIPKIIKAYGSGDFNAYVNMSYENLYTFLSGGCVFDSEYNFKIKKNPWGNNKWQINSRYYWVNFTNIVFGKHDTIEFRLHTPTTNSDKIINWLLMCNAIMEYAKNYPYKCISTDEVTFKDVLNFYGKKYKTSYAMNLSQRLITYYETRVEKFKKDKEANNFLSLDEITNDSTFKYNALNINI